MKLGTKPPAKAPAAPPGSTNKGDDPVEFRLVRQLLVGPERRELETLKEGLQRLDEGVIDRFGKGLERAVEGLGAGGQSSLASQFRDAVEKAVQSSVTTDKTRLSQSLFPIMGSAIREYVGALFKGMIEDLNEMIRNTTSLRRLRWRAEAKLTGKPYSEYLLLKTLNYSVEEIFLIERDSGLLLCHVALDDEDDRDADLVSGMFSAIRSFAQDSFGDGGADGEEAELGRLTFGNLEIVIEAGPRAIIAAAVDGTPPPQFRELLGEILEELHTRFPAALENSNGDQAESAAMAPVLEKALIANKRETSSGTWRVWAAAALLLGLLGLWWWNGVRESKRWEGLVNSLDAEPGIEMVTLGDAGGGRRIVRGMRDPLAATPSNLALLAGIGSDEVEFNFAPYHSLEPQFVAARKAEEGRLREAELGGIRSVLRATENRSRRAQLELAQNYVKSRFGWIDGLVMDFGESDLRVSGEVAEPHYSILLRELPQFASVGAVELSKLRNRTQINADRLVEAGNAWRIFYRSGSSEMAEGQGGKISEAAALLQELSQNAALLGKSVEVQIRAIPLVGSNDEYLVQTARKRLGEVEAGLVAEGVPGQIFTMNSVDRERLSEGRYGVVYLRVNLADPNSPSDHGGPKMETGG